MNTNQTFNTILETFIKVVNKYNALNDVAFDYGTGERLFPSEIHALNAVRQSEKQNITELGKALGITKSAASQVVDKLTKKGMIRKYKAAENEKEVLIGLTDQGNRILTSFETMRSDIFRQLIADFESLDEKETELIQYLFKRIDAHFDEKLKERSGINHSNEP